MNKQLSRMTHSKHEWKNTTVELGLVGIFWGQVYPHICECRAMMDSRGSVISFTIIGTRLINE